MTCSICGAPARGRCHTCAAPICPAHGAHVGHQRELFCTSCEGLYNRLSGMVLAYVTEALYTHALAPRIIYADATALMQFAPPETSALRSACDILQREWEQRAVSGDQIRANAGVVILVQSFPGGDLSQS